MDRVLQKGLANRSASFGWRSTITGMLIALAGYILLLTLGLVGGASLIQRLLMNDTALVLVIGGWAVVSALVASALGSYLTRRPTQRLRTLRPASLQ